MEGWQCPNCGKVHNPIVMECNCSLSLAFKQKQAIEQPCLWDSMSETSPGSGIKIGRISCTCPKCTSRY